MIVSRHLLWSMAAPAALCGIASPAQAQTRSFDVAAQPAASGIPELARQADVQIMVSERATQGKSINAVRGTMAVEEALRRALAGTGLRIRSNDGRTILLAGEAAQAPLPVSAAALLTDDASAQSIVVTGSRIRNIEAIASPLSSYSRDEIERSSRTDMAGFLETIPQNFSGGSLPLSPDGIFGGGSAALLNPTGAVAPNLRGLGAGSTLTLLNGQRLPALAGSSIVDISAIPVGAIERIDIIADGASAVYGSDAVGGVVNVVLRDELDGAETRASYELASRGDYGGLDVSQALGTSWESGSFLVTGRYRDRSALKASDRAASRTMGSFIRGDLILESDIYPASDQYSAFGVFRQRVGGVKLGADIWYNRNTQEQGTGSTASFLLYDARSDQFVANLSLVAPIIEDIELTVTGGHAREHTFVNQLTYSQAAGLYYDVDIDQRSRLNNLAFNLTGSILTLPAGTIAFAIGGEHRSEGISRDFTGTAAFAAAAERTVNSAYGELLVPLFRGEGFPGRGTLSLAGRYDDYSDFGDTWNGKIGLSLAPTPGVKLRGTYSTSFRAPALTDLSSSGIYSIYGTDNSFFSPDRPGQRANVILLQGYAAGLKPETARVLTLGADLAPAFVPGLTLSATWFDYDYRDRLTLPPYNTSILLQPEVFGGLSRRIGSLGEVEAIIAAAQAAGQPVRYRDPSIPLSAYEYVIDLTFRNIAAQKVQGLDFDLRYSTDIGAARISASLAATYLIDFQRQITDGAGSLEYAGLFGEAPDLKLRGSLSVSQGGFGGTLSISHLSDFQNSLVIPYVPVDSFTTADLDLRYRVNEGALGGHTTLSFGVRNLLDSPPPFVRRPLSQVQYDPSNANPLGRMLRVSLTQNW